MKKPYQIEAQRAVKQLEEMATDGNPAVQMVLPMAEMLGWLARFHQFEAGLSKTWIRLWLVPPPHSAHD